MAESNRRRGILLPGIARAMTCHDGAPYPPGPGGPTPLRVLVHPHLDEANPYLRLLADALDAVHVESEAFSWRRLLGSQRDVLHVHWPELAVGPRSRWKAAVAIARFAVTVVAARARGLTVVWTVHNLGSHEGWHPILERALFRWWTRQVDGALTLSNWARAEALKRYPRLLDVPFTTVGHGDYPVSREPTRDEARQALGIDPEAKVALHFGHLRSYKGTDHLIRTFSETPLDMMLLVSGRARPRSFGEQLQNLAAADARVRLTTEQASAHELRQRLAACDVVLLPYRDVTHSGSVVLALCSARPTVSTATGSMPELQAEVGAGWLWLLNPQYDADELETMLTRVAATTPMTRVTMVSQGWTDIARRTRALYDRARDQGEAPSP